MAKGIHLNSETLKHLFPFYIAINRSFCIQSIGASLSKFLELSFNESFQQYFTITHPVVVSPSFDALLRQTDSLFVLKLKESNIEMKGQLIFDSHDDLLLFLCEPVIRQIDELSKAGLKLSDFAKHSQVCDYMFMLQAELAARSSLDHTLQALRKSNQDLLQAEEKFQQAQKMEAIGTLVGGIAHDFNNMLAGITGNLYLAQKEVRDDQVSLTKRLKRVEKVSFRAANMIQQLLTFARKGLVSMQELHLNSFIEDTLQLSQSTLPETIDFSCQISRDDLLVKADETQVHQILLNLLNNARDAVAKVKQPCVSLTLKRFHADDAWLSHQKKSTQEWAHITVTDNGEGISEQNIKHLFEPFFTTKEQGKGTGLGLSMVYGAVQTHQGIIEVESDEGNGTSFHIYLPLIQNAHQPAAINLPVDDKTCGEVILLADDEIEVRETTAEVLHEFGYKVIQAKDGLEAIDLYDNNKSDIDLALLDLVMPHCSGIELVQKLRNINPELPIILITGYDKTHVFKDSEPISHCEILSKPVNFDVLQATIRSMIHPARK